MYTNDNFHSHSFPIPSHIAIIPDGGRRWAKEHNINFKEAYFISVKRIKMILEELYGYGIQYISVYFSSTQNFSRSEYEVKSYCDAGWEGIMDELLPWAMHNGISIKIIGKHDDNYKPFEDKAVYVEQQTLFKDARKLFICFNYNSLDEIEEAFRKKNSKRNSFVNYLDILYPVDILIRTGGAQTLSGFLLPQVAFARLFFLDKLFNDLTISDIRQIMTTYKNYDLKYGE